MKSIRISLFLALLAILNTSLAIAQETAGGSSSVSSTTSTVTTSKTDADWINSPWVWIVAGAVFILILAAVLTNGRSRARNVDAATTQRTTITRTDEVSND